MRFNGFEIHALPRVEVDSCKKCKVPPKPVSNGFFSKAWFCPKCESVYLLGIRKAPKKMISERFLEQCRKEVANS